MTAVVVPFTAKPSATAEPCDCHRHRLAALLDRVQAITEAAEDELLVPAAVLLDLAADVTATTTAVLAEPAERTNP